MHTQQFLLLLFTQQLSFCLDYLWPFHVWAINCHVKKTWGNIDTLKMYTLKNIYWSIYLYTVIMLEVMHRMILNLWNNLDLPNAWGNSRLKTLWRGKGSKRDPTKYCGTSIGSTMCKLVISIILSRLKGWYEIQWSDEQYGFRSNRGTTDGIYLCNQKNTTDNKP